MDDPMYIWSAKHILENPFDFYGFEVNWRGFPLMMYEENQNPPLTSYFMAIVGGIFGWAEPTLHLAFLIPAIGTAAGTYFLASRWLRFPGFATLAAALSPVFLISASNTMADVLMLCFYIWAIGLWVAGLERQRRALLVAAGIAAGCAFFAKYFGASSALLMAAFALATGLPAKRWAPYLAIPLGAVLLYEFYTHQIYGTGLVSDAFLFAQEKSAAAGSVVERTLRGLSFLGGGFLLSLFLFPVALGTRQSAILAVIAVLSVLLIVFTDLFPLSSIEEGQEAPLTGVALAAVFVAAGALSLYLAVLAYAKARSPETLMWALWIVGTFIFATYLNWSTTARTFLPTVVPLACVLTHFLEQRVQSLQERSARSFGAAAAVAASALVAVVVLRADAALADSQRRAAATFRDELAHTDAPVYFQGHWGFQYYMERWGAKPINFNESRLPPRALMIAPRNNTQVVLLPKGAYRAREVIEISGPTYVTTMSDEMGAGFYSSVFGPLPYAIGRVPPEVYFMYAF